VYKFEWRESKTTESDLPLIAVLDPRTGVCRCSLNACLFASLYGSICMQRVQICCRHACVLALMNKWCRCGSCAHIYIICMSASRFWVCKCARINVCIHVFICMYICLSVCLCMYLFMYMYVLCMYVYVILYVSFCARLHDAGQQLDFRKKIKMGHKHLVPVCFAIQCTLYKCVFFSTKVPKKIITNMRIYDVC